MSKYIFNISNIYISYCTWTNESDMWSYINVKHFIWNICIYYIYLLYTIITTFILNKTQNYDQYTGYQDILFGLLKDKILT